MEGHSLSKGQLPYTILASANSCLDWLLMAQPAIPSSHMEMRQIQVKRSDWRGNYPANHTEDEKGRPSEPGWGEGV